MYNAVKNIMSAPELTELPDTGTEINLEYFKACLKEYLKLDEEMKTLSKALKQRRDKQNNLNVSLLTFLNKNEINQVQLEGVHAGQELLSDKVVRERTPSASSIIGIINSKLVNNPELLKSITDEINSQRESVEVEKLKIAKVKAKKTKPQEESDLSNALLNSV